ncbi:MAG TPA: sterol desaturase family protein [Planctomycetaceae bacterium]|nr:sterol desaturase family protein [Planctomycetaceae bacterium]
MPTSLPSWAPALKPALSVALLVVFWTWETVAPLAQGRGHRWRHAARNLAIAILNTALLSLFFGTATVAVSVWAAESGFGLLNASPIPWPWRLPVAVLMLDGWLYVWHRLNHEVPFLWRFHRMHHADGEMDVTTATRFHFGEHVGAATLRLGVIPLLGVNLVEIVVFETLVVAVTMFHHANLSLGRFDPLLRWFVVTPRMHQIHHSRLPSETNSNYSTLLPVWDRSLRTYRTRPGGEPIVLGLDEFADPRWQTVKGMLGTPFKKTA